MTEKQKIRRFHSLKELYRLMVIEGKWSGVEIDERLLRHCIESYYDDLRRHKNYHFIEVADRHKRASYMMKWIVRIRPVQLIPTTTAAAAAEETHKFLVNESYAFYVALNYLNIGSSDLLSADYTRNFLYNLHYRPIVAEALASEMYLLEQAVHGQPP
ncbi:MAG: hypothetical protein HQL65_18555 [Magnetococcales bacterium]|nr:hypothetical protein [Magnetococcales bacterium]